MGSCHKPETFLLPKNSHFSRKISIFYNLLAFLDFLLEKPFFKKL